MKRYLVIDEKCGDTFTKVFESEKEASDQARMDWNYLTDAEKKDRHIYVAEVTEDDLYEDAFEDGKVDWAFFHSCNPVGFDSKEE
ncbi:MAG: hypothetical protein ACI4TK_00610 [Agathobacter sp.]